MKKRFTPIILLLTLCSMYAYASDFVPIMLSCGPKKACYIGTIQLDDTIYGLLLTPKLQGLPPGVHGFHVAPCSICGNESGNGEHFDPLKTEHHLGPYQGNGHLGDLPFLYVDQKGRATLPVLAPRLRRKDIFGRTLTIDVGSDNYADEPYWNGGGGALLACGSIPRY